MITIYSLQKMLLAFLISFNLLSNEHDAKVIKVNDINLNNIQIKKNETLVINFWATWCTPCLKEFPDFLKLRQQHKDIKVKFVSIDQLSRLKVVNNMYRKLNSVEGNYLLDANNKELRSFDPEWDLSVPYTLIVSNGKKTKRISKSLDYNELIKIIKQ